MWVPRCGSPDCRRAPEPSATVISADVMNVEGVTVRNVSGDGVLLAGYLNCPQNLKGVVAQGNCTGLALEGVHFPGAKPYYCDGALVGKTSGCSPPVCHLNSSSKS